MGRLPISDVVSECLQGEAGDCIFALLLLEGEFVHVECLFFLVVHAHEARFELRRF